MSDPRDTVLAELVTPQLANGLGTLFGGELLALVDKAAYVAAVRYSSLPCVTANFDKVEFLEPVAVGELVSVQARVVAVGTTSLSVRIKVDAEALESGNRRPVFNCFVTMVALKEGKPAPVPRFSCTDIAECREYLIARHRRELEREYSRRLAAVVAEVEAMNEAAVRSALAGEG